MPTTDTQDTQPVQLSEAESRVLALQIETLKSILVGIDWPYFEAMLASLDDHAANYAIGAVLNRQYTPNKGNLLSAQADALRHLLAFHNALKRCDELKAAANRDAEAFGRLSRAFGDF